MVHCCARMPCYEYRCTQCGLEEDRIVRIADRDTQTCDCGQNLCRVEISESQARMDSFFVGGAILGDGSVVKGNFGRRRERGRSKNCL